MWFRADYPGNGLNVWENFANPFQFNAYYNGNQTIDTTFMNFEKAFLLSNNEGFVVPNYLPKSNQKFHVFIVYKAYDSLSENGLWQLYADTSMIIKLSTQKLKGTKKYIRYDDFTSLTPMINSSNHNWRRQNIDSLMNEHLMFGKIDSFPFNGKLAEFVYFEDNLKKIDIEKIHTYLSFKYGIGIYNLNYVNSNDRIIWNQVDNEEFKFDIVGLGRDDSLGIYQKQSSAQGGNSALTLYYNDLQELNKANTTVIANNNFILWGNNNASMTDYEVVNIGNEEVQIMACKWRLRAVGDDIRQMPVDMRMHAELDDDDKTLALIISQDGESRIDIQNVTIIYADSIDTNNNYYFKSLRLDIDENEKDVFTFMKAYKPNQNRRGNGGGNSLNTNDSNATTIVVEPKIEVYPNPNNGDFRVDISTPQTVQLMANIYDVNGRLIKSRRFSGSNTYSYTENISGSGVYLLKVEGANFTESYRIVIK